MTTTIPKWQWRTESFPLQSTDLRFHVNINSSDVIRQEFSLWLMKYAIFRFSDGDNHVLWAESTSVQVYSSSSLREILIYAVHLRARLFSYDLAMLRFILCSKNLHSTLSIQGELIWLASLNQSQWCAVVGRRQSEEFMFSPRETYICSSAIQGCFLHITLISRPLFSPYIPPQHLVFYYCSHPLLPHPDHPPSPSFPNFHFGSAPGHWVTATAQFSHCSLYWTPHQVNQGEQMWRHSHQLSTAMLQSYRWACLISGPGAEGTNTEMWRRRKCFSIVAHSKTPKSKRWYQGNFVRISVHHYIKWLHLSQ